MKRGYGIILLVLLLTVSVLCSCAERPAEQRIESPAVSRAPRETDAQDTQDATDTQDEQDEQDEQDAQDAQDEQDAQDVPPEETETEDAVNTIKSGGVEADSPAQNADKRTVRFSEKDYKTVRSAIENTKTVYPYTDIMNLEAALAKYAKLPAGWEKKAETVSGVLSQGTLNESVLYNTVKENNKKYRIENPSNFMYSDPDDDYLKHICGIISDTVNSELRNYTFPKAFLGELDYTLTNLCVFSNTTYFNNAFVTDEGYLLISPLMIESMKTIVKNDKTEQIVISHEVEHIFQKISTKKRETLGAERGWGFCLTFPDLEVNSLHFNWFLEAAAEKLAVRLYDSAPITYTTKIGYMDSLTFVSLLNDSVSVDDIPRLTQQYSLDHAFDVFGCDTPEKKMEFLELMYAINIIQEEPKDFIDVYEQRVGHAISEDELSDMKIRLKAGVCTTLSKYFYENLSRKMIGGDIGLSDIFMTIALFEADLNLHIIYEDESRYETIKDFINSYCRIQAAFFESVAGALNISASELQDSYNTFNAAVKVPQNSMLYPEESGKYDPITFSWLSAEKNGFLTGHYGSVMLRKTVTIRQTQNTKS